jgi:hypothetical protein
MPYDTLYYTAITLQEGMTMMQGSIPERTKHILTEVGKSRTSIGLENRRPIVLPTAIAVLLFLALLSTVFGLIILLLMRLFRVLRRQSK